MTGKLKKNGSKNGLSGRPARGFLSEAAIDGGRLRFSMMAFLAIVGILLTVSAPGNEAGAYGTTDYNVAYEDDNGNVLDIAKEQYTDDYPSLDIIFIQTIRDGDTVVATMELFGSPDEEEPAAYMIKLGDMEDDENQAFGFYINGTQFVEYPDGWKEFQDNSLDDCTFTWQFNIDMLGTFEDFDIKGITVLRTGSGEDDLIGDLVYYKYSTRVPVRGYNPDDPPVKVGTKGSGGGDDETQIPTEYVIILGISVLIVVVALIAFAVRRFGSKEKGEVGGTYDDGWAHPGTPADSGHAITPVENNLIETPNKMHPRLPVHDESDGSEEVVIWSSRDDKNTPVVVEVWDDYYQA